MKSAFKLLVCLVLLTGCRHVEEERFRADARINGKPVRFAYDTGAEMTLLLTRPAKRLGLEVVKPPAGSHPPAGKVRVGQTGFCQFTVGAESGRLKLATYRSPWWVPWDVDGLIGWPDMQDDFIMIDANQAAIKAAQPLPDTNGWCRLALYRRTGVLALEIPRPDGQKGVLEVDTGNSGGISLSPERWKEWRGAHRGAHWKMHVNFMPGSGMGIGRTFGGNEVTLGPLRWTNLPVSRANQTEMAVARAGDVFEASIGVAALKQLDLLIDQKNHVAYARPRRQALTAPSAGRKKGQVSANDFPSTVHLNLQAHQYLDLAVDALESQKFSEAVTNATRCLELQPDNASLLALRGEALFNLHAADARPDKLVQPLDDFTRALELDPNLVEAYFERANLYYLSRRWDDAARDYRHFCDTYPEEANYARFYLWLSRARQGQRAEADRELAGYFEFGKKLKATPWEKTIAGFLLGRISEPDFLHAAARLGGKKDAGPRCEAWFFAGMKCRLSGDAVTADQYLEQCVATGKKDYYEYNFAAAELRNKSG